MFWNLLIKCCLNSGAGGLSEPGRSVKCYHFGALRALGSFLGGLGASWGPRTDFSRIFVDFQSILVDF